MGHHIVERFGVAQNCDTSLGVFLVDCDRVGGASFADQFSGRVSFHDEESLVMFCGFVVADPVLWNHRTLNFPRAARSVRPIVGVESTRSWVEH